MYDYADKIAKLLRKAESTTSDPERDALIAKAQKLMTTYSIDEAMLAGKGDAVREEIVQTVLEYVGIFQGFTMGIGSTIARANGCRTVFHKRTYTKPTAHLLTVHGFESDVRRVEMLNASLQVQCADALNRWWKTVDSSWMSAMERFKNRRQFVIGFNTGLHMQLQRATAEAKQETVARIAAEESKTEDEVSSSVALVLRDRKDAVDDWMDKNYGKLASRTRRYSSGSTGQSAGMKAGLRANAGQHGSVGAGGKGALGA